MFHTFLIFLTVKLLKTDPAVCEHVPEITPQFTQFLDYFIFRPLSVVQTSEITTGMLPAPLAPLGFLAFTVIGIFLKRPHIIGPVLEINCRVKEPLKFWSRPHAVYGDFVCSNKLAN